jgi:hypothetical protein
MTNLLSILLLSTNWLGDPIPSVQVSYTATGPFAMLMSRDLKQWQMIVATTNQGPHKGQILLPQMDRSYFKLGPVYVGVMP